MPQLLLSLKGIFCHQEVAAPAQEIIILLLYSKFPKMILLLFSSILIHDKWNTIAS